jgi:septal ring factor EnvC (AmiA/AmiB activator)
LFLSHEKDIWDRRAKEARLCDWLAAARREAADARAKARVDAAAFERLQAEWD